MSERERPERRERSARRLCEEDVWFELDRLEGRNSRSLDDGREEGSPVDEDGDQDGILDAGEGEEGRMTVSRSSMMSCRSLRPALLSPSPRRDPQSSRFHSHVETRVESRSLEALSAGGRWQEREREVSSTAQSQPSPLPSLTPDLSSSTKIDATAPKQDSRDSTEQPEGTRVKRKSVF